jgi:hypothetical protein
MQHAPPSLERGNPPELPEYPTEEEREARARWEIEHVKWRTPHCRPSGYHEAFNSDLNEISRIVWITELSHARVRQMRDEFLDGRDVLKREQEVRRAYRLQTWQRIKMTNALHFNRLDCVERDVRRAAIIRPRQRRTCEARPHRRAAARPAAGVRSGTDPGDPEPAEPSAARVLANGGH